MRVQAISKETHLSFVRSLSSASFLQTPAWGAVKRDWRAESLGFFAGDSMVGVALVLHRSLPRLGRSLAYLPEGPVVAWDQLDVAAALEALAAYLKTQGAFAVRIGPPVITHRWSADTLKRGLADPAITRLSELPADTVEPLGQQVEAALRVAGWRALSVDGGFAAGQPDHNFQLPLRAASGAQLTEAELLAGMNQLWRRNIKRAEREGVQVRQGTSAADLAAFHALYVETAHRDHFTPRPASYFTVMAEALRQEEPDRFTLSLAEHEGDLVAATISIRVGTHAWYSYGASSHHKRDVRGSNAIQWALIRQAVAAGCAVYDMRGITTTLDAEDPHVGLITFKVGTGGEAVRSVGEWDLPLSRPLYAAFRAYLKGRR